MATVISLIHLEIAYFKYMSSSSLCLKRALSTVIFNSYVIACLFSGMTLFYTLFSSNPYMTLRCSG